MYLFDILFKLTKVEKIAKKCYNRNSWTHMCSAIKYGGARICAKRRLFFGSKGWSSSLTWFRSWDSFLAQATCFSPLPSATSGKNGRLLSAKSLRRLTFTSMATSRFATATRSIWRLSTRQFSRTWSATTPTTSCEPVAAHHNDAPGGVSKFETPPLFFLHQSKRKKA